MSKTNKSKTLQGSVITMIGYISSSFANSIPMLCLTLGVLSGAGSGIANIAGVVIISKYFKKDVAMAQGIGSAGVGFGCFCLAPLEGYLIWKFGWARLEIEKKINYTDLG